MRARLVAVVEVGVNRMNALTPTDWWGLFGHFLLLSMLSVGGAITTVSDMHRYVVTDKHWMTDATFSSSVALAQAAPGPNLLFVPVVGYQIAGLTGAAVTLVGMLLPSTLLALTASRWLHTHRDTLGVRAFVSGVMPITLGLLFATSWVLFDSLKAGPLSHNVPLAIVVLVSALAAWRTKLAPVFLVTAGAILGALGWV